MNLQTPQGTLTSLQKGSQLLWTSLIGRKAKSGDKSDRGIAWLLTEVSA